MSFIPCHVHQSLDNWRSGDSDKYSSTVPVGMEMSSPLVTPTSPPYTHNGEEVEEDYEEEEAGWSSGDFSNSDDEACENYIPKIEVRDNYSSLKYGVRVFTFYSYWL